MLFSLPWLITILTGLSSAAVIENRASACSADNCARAVTGTVSGKAPSLESRKSDCSSFLRRTVTPDVVTSTRTVTVTSSVVLPVQTTTTATVTITQSQLITNVKSITSTSVMPSVTTQTTTTVVGTVTVTSNAPAAAQIRRDDELVQARAITRTNSAVPSYASPCSGTVRYSSACSCFGVTASTTTLIASTTYTTVTLSQTPTLTTVTGTQTLTNSASVTVSMTVTVTTIVEVDTTSVSTSITTTSATATQTVINSCPTQAVVNGGFEDGTTTPFVFTNGPNFFDNPGGDLRVLNDAALAHSGSYLASVVETDSSLGGLNFRLTQTVTVCAGASYTLNFYTSSQFNPAGSTQCNLQACVGSVCTSFDPSPGNQPNQLVSVAFPGSAATSVDIVVYTPEIFSGTGITFCGRQFVRFDDFSLTFVA